MIKNGEVKRGEITNNNFESTHFEFVFLLNKFLCQTLKRVVFCENND